jgi:tetratricopeptide (TPR) repeat protein
MTQPFKTQHPEIDELFDRYRRAPQSTVFAPLADACRKAGMIEEALDICRKGLVANTEYASGYVVQGKCLYDAEQPEAAEEAFRKVLELDSANLVALKFIGIILSERGDTGAARACFEHILALDPDDRDIRRRLDEVAVPEPATRRVQPPVQPPVSSEVSRGRARDEELEEELETLVMRSRPPESVDEEERFEGAPIELGKSPETTDEIATMTLADIYAAQGYTEKALRIYREVHRRQPNNADLSRKIDALEARAERRAATDAAEVVEKAEAPEPAEAAPAPAPARPAHNAAGSQIDEGRSYEQFKRWLRRVSD